MTATTVLEPDIVVFSDRSKTDEYGGIAPPLFVIEIMTPLTAVKDMREKRAAYERAGVPEYWVIDPFYKHVHVFTMNEYGRYGAQTIFIDGEEAPVGVLPGLVIDLTRVFKNPFQR